MTTTHTEIETVELNDVAPYLDDGDNKRVTHIVNPAMNGHIQAGVPMNAQEIVDKARFFRQEVIALCGAKFVPEHNPEKYDACKPCIDIAGIIITEDG